MSAPKGGSKSTSKIQESETAKEAVEGEEEEEDLGFDSEAFNAHVEALKGKQQQEQQQPSEEEDIQEVTGMEIVNPFGSSKRKISSTEDITAKRSKGEDESSAIDVEAIEAQRKAALEEKIAAVAPPPPTEKKNSRQRKTLVDEVAKIQKEWENEILSKDKMEQLKEGFKKELEEINQKCLLGHFEKMPFQAWVGKTQVKAEKSESTSFHFHSHFTLISLSFSLFF